MTDKSFKLHAACVGRSYKLPFTRNLIKLSKGGDRVGFLFKSMSSLHDKYINNSSNRKFYWSCSSVYQTAANFLQFSIPTSYSNQQLLKLSYLLRIIEVVRRAKSIGKMNPFAFLLQIQSRRHLPKNSNRFEFVGLFAVLQVECPCDLLLKTLCVNCSWDKSLRPVLRVKSSGD